MPYWKQILYLSRVGLICNNILYCHKCSPKDRLGSKGSPLNRRTHRNFGSTKVSLECPAVWKLGRVRFRSDVSIQWCIKQTDKFSFLYSSPFFHSRRNEITWLQRFYQPGYNFFILNKNKFRFQRTFEDAYGSSNRPRSRLANEKKMKKWRCSLQKTYTTSKVKSASRNKAHLVNGF